MSSRRTLRAVLGAALLTAVLATLPTISQPVAAQDSQPVTIHFRAMVGDEPFACGKRYPGIGTTGATITPADFRFYVSDVALVNDAGQAVPVTLDQDNRWQYKSVALLDFEDKSGPCANGTPQTRDIVVGTVPTGSYRGLRFSLGVPADLNHEDSTIAPSPLNVTTMFWTWQYGYKFFRVDLEPDRSAMPAPGAGMPGMPAPGPDAAGMHGMDMSNGWAIHLGSTACRPLDQPAGPSDCEAPNRPTVDLPGLDPTSGVVVADLKALLAQTNVEVNQPESAFGCMSAPDDGDCAGIMAGFGLPFGDQPSPGQTLFRAQ
jgi:uncharacterized repeat protein (TIGR04052 family)